MYVLSFGGCGDRDRLNLYAELLTDQDAVPAFQSILADMEEMFKSDDDEISFSKMLAEAGMKDDTAYQPQDTIVFIMDDYSSKFSFRKFGGGSRAARGVKFPPANRS